MCLNCLFLFVTNIHTKRDLVHGNYERRELEHVVKVICFCEVISGNKKKKGKKKGGEKAAYNLTVWNEK